MPNSKKAFIILFGLVSIFFLLKKFLFVIKPKSNPERDILNDIFNCSDEQLLIDRSILLQTMSFMLQETDELGLLHTELRINSCYVSAIIEQRKPHAPSWSAFF